MLAAAGGADALEPPFSSDAPPQPAVTARASASRAMSTVRASRDLQVHKVDRVCGQYCLLIISVKPNRNCANFFALVRDPSPCAMNKIERIKAEKDGLDVYAELMRAAHDGYETLAERDMALLKWYGLYQHNTQDGHFMLRIKVVQGVLTGEQAETIAGIAADFGRGIVDCTTRQCVQIHWITLEQGP